MKLTQNLILICLSAAFILLLSSACEYNRFNQGEALYQQRKYAAAIEILDNYIDNSRNGAIMTKAELTRSASYYELGLLAMNKENWQLAIRLFKLANSETADKDLAVIYNLLADQAILANDYPLATQYLNLLIEEVPISDLVPLALQKRIKIHLDINNEKEKAWQDYMTMYGKYPDNTYEILTRPLIARFINSMINDAVIVATRGDYRTALNQLFKIGQYPVADSNLVNLEVANIYLEQAELNVQEQKYPEAHRFFRIAIQYYPQKKEFVDKRLTEIAKLYIKKGDDYLAVRDFENALNYYEKSFEIISDFSEAKTAIAKMNVFKANIERAADIAAEAQKLESAKNFPDAQRLYQQAYQIDNLPKYQESAFIMANLIEAEKGPVPFARKIINEYQDGMLKKRISQKKEELLKAYKQNEIKDSGWKILLSPGQYKYEARYDLITPGDSYFYVWQVNIRDKSVIPLNKISEKLMQ